MMKGAMWKRVYYFVTSVCRGITFLGLLIAFIIVEVKNVSPTWLEVFLICLAIANLLTGAFALILCGFTATLYNQTKWLQILCFVITLLTGGIISSTFCGVATFVDVEQDEIDAEGIFNVKGHNKELKDEEKK